MAWRLVSLFEEETYVQEPPSLQFKLRAGVTAFGDAAPLATKREPSDDELTSSTYVFLGGHIHETDDPAIRDLWLASGFEVEVI